MIKRSTRKTGVTKVPAVMEVPLQGRVISALESWGEAGNSFTFSQLRKAAGVDPDSSENDTLWNLWRSLQDTDAVREVRGAGDRKRNRLFQVSRLERLHAFKPMGDDVVPVPLNLEQRVEKLEEQVQKLVKAFSAVIGG
jgi:hypothetical protein